MEPRLWRAAFAKPRRLIIRNREAGFFSNFNAVLNNLRYRLGKRGIEAAVVEWQALDGRQFAYGRSADGNLWNHFFELLPFERLPGASREVSTFARRMMTGRGAYALYELGGSWRQDYHDLFQRYIRVRAPIRARAERLYAAAMAGRFCAGAHFRNPAHGECLHPMPTPAEFIARLRQLLPADRPWVVFLASDYEPAVAAFREAFGDRLALQPDVHRAITRAQGHLHHGNAAPDVSLGEEVLVDCLLLARCDVMVHVTSNIATAAGYMNPALTMVYCETKTQAALGYLWSLGRSIPGWDTLHRLRTGTRAAARRIAVRAGFRALRPCQGKPESLRRDPESLWIGAQPDG